MSNTTLLSIANLHVRIGNAHIVRGIDLAITKGEVLALVGESGCGKSISMQAILQLLPENFTVTAGSVRFGQRDLLALSPAGINNIRGTEIAMIFQNPMGTFNPTMTIGDQIGETLVVHRGLSRRAARQEAARLLQRTQVPEATHRIHQYPHEFSGGMLQRAAIAMALACKPKLLIADEPTTALDVTIQHQILHLIKELQQEEQLALILITHDLGLVAKTADRVAVMYAGEIIETGTVDDLFYRTAHPYTQGLIRALPGFDKHKSLQGIAGTPPDPAHGVLPGCAFAPRCPQVLPVCTQQAPATRQLDAGHLSRCWLTQDQAVTP